MASYVFYPGDGAQTDFSVPFPYLSKDHVKVYSNGVALTPTWINSALIRVSPAVPSGLTLLVQRVTVKTPLTVFENTNNLTAENLTLAETQALFIAEEASDRAEQSIVIDEATGQYDFGGRRATNVADPVNDKDAVTKQWATTSMTSVLAQAISQAVSATNSAIAAAADAASAAADRFTISGWKDTIEGWKNTISGWKDTIEGWKNSVSTWKDQAAASQSAAATSATNASGSATASATSASNALTSEGKAKTSETNAKTSETNAATSAAAAAASAGSVDATNILTKTDNLAGLADKAAARTALGLGNVAVKNVATTAEIRNNTNAGAVSVDAAWAAADWIDLGTVTGTVTIDGNNGSRFKMIAGSAITITPVNFKKGQPLDLLIYQDASGGRTVSFNMTYFAFPNGQVPAAATAANTCALVYSGVFNFVGWFSGAGWKVA